jgi:hypothetical protein
MPTPRVNGSLLPVRTRIQRSYDPNKGMVIRQEFESAGDNLGGIANQCIENGISFDETSSGRRSRISFESSGNTGGGRDINTDTWQLMANELSDDVINHPRARALPAVPDTNSLKNVLAQVKKFQENGTVATLTGDALLLYDLLTHGKDKYPVGQYVLMHTTNVAGSYAANISDLNVESTYSTAALVTEISDTSLWSNPCPARLIYKIQNIEAQIESDTYTLWGWRKLPSKEIMTANNRIEISTEYWLGAWSRLCFAQYGTNAEFGLA